LIEEIETMALKWDNMTTEERVERLREELDDVRGESKRLKKAIEEQNSVIANMGFRFAKLS
jgi:predicted  nucleic acid-binding Zn-ribbon protein